MSRQSETPKQAKKPYRTPAFRSFGRINELTLTNFGTGGPLDGGDPNTSNSVYAS